MKIGEASRTWSCRTMNEHEIVKNYLAVTPVDDRLPIGWEVRFGRRGKFMKYDSIEHAERKNKAKYPEQTVPFGGCNREWEVMKSIYAPGDEFWIFGADGTSILMVRDNEIIKEMVMMCV